jgi:hypothetical protein
MDTAFDELGEKNARPGPPSPTTGKRERNGSICSLNLCQKGAKNTPRALDKLCLLGDNDGAVGPSQLSGNPR